MLTSPDEDKGNQFQNVMFMIIITCIISYLAQDEITFLPSIALLSNTLLFCPTYITGTVQRADSLCKYIFTLTKMWL